MASTVGPCEPVGPASVSRFVAIEELGGHIDGGSDEGLFGSSDDDGVAGNCNVGGKSLMTPFLDYHIHTAPAINH